MQYLNNFASLDGLRDLPKMNAANTVPIPTPAPANPMVAEPAPLNFAASLLMLLPYIPLLTTSLPSRSLSVLTAFRGETSAHHPIALLANHPRLHVFPCTHCWGP